MNHSSKAHDPDHEANISANESSTPFHINNILCTATKTINITNKNHTLKPPTHPSSHLSSHKNDPQKTLYEELSAITDDSQTKFKIHDFSAILTQRLTTNMLNDSIEHEKPISLTNRATERLNTDDNTDLVSRDIITPESRPLQDYYRSNLISAKRPERKESHDSIVDIDNSFKGIHERSIRNEGENGYNKLVTFQEESPVGSKRTKYQKILQRAVNVWRMKRMMQLALDDRDKNVLKGVDIEHKNEQKSLWKRLKTENINPQSQYLALWRFFFQVTNILFCVVFPYRLSFHANITERNLPNILMEIIDGFFFIEILLKFFVARRRPDGTLITNRTLIAMTYFKETFLLDVIALLPYQYFSGHIAILKLFRIIHLNSIFERMGRLTEILVPFFVKDLTALVKAEFIANLSTILIVLAIIVHFCSCIWIALGFANGPDELTWLSYLPNPEYDSIHSAEITENKSTVYIASLFITAETLTTVGYGTTNFFTLREQVFSMILLFFGILLFALFFEKLNTLTTLLNQTALLQEQKTDEVNAWLMRLNKGSGGEKEELVPYQLIDLMRKALLNNIDNLSWQNLIVDSKQFRQLDPTTKNTILNAVIRVMKNKFHIIFQNLSQDCSFEILNSAHSKHFMPGNIIIHKGQDIKGLFLILEGSVFIANKQTSQNFARLGSNSFFGETFLIGTQSSSFYFIAENNVSCLFIKEDDMKRIENNYPQDFRKLKDIAEARKRHFAEQSSRTIIIGSNINIHNEEEDSDSYVSDRSSSDGDDTDSDTSDSDDEANKSDLFPMETLVPDLEEISQAPQINEYLKERMEFLEEKLESIKGILKVESEYLWKKSEIYCKKFGKRE